VQIADQACEADLATRFGRDAAPLRAELFQRALRLTRNHHDAEDLLQETLANAYRGYRMFREGSNFRAWLYRIETNTFINGYRKRQRSPVQSPIADITDSQLAEDASRSSRGLCSAEDLALEALPDSDVRTAMQALPEQFRTAVYYADVAGYQFKEIAAITNVPIGTVMSRLHRGRRQLRRLLADTAHERGYVVPDDTFRAAG
jgi:RNA polymerase sigma-70 factor, ECF subfamily